jgi:hypothetical protein
MVSFCLQLCSIRPASLIILLSVSCAVLVSPCRRSMFEHTVVCLAIAGVIVESEDLHRRAYNAAFQQFDIRCPDADGDSVVDWSVEYYDDLQNTVGGGKPKMRHYFGASATVVTRPVTHTALRLSPQRPVG